MQVLAGDMDVEQVPTKTFREIQEAFKQSQALYQELAATCAELQAAADAAPPAPTGKPVPGKTPPEAKKGAPGKVRCIVPHAVQLVGSSEWPRRASSSRSELTRWPRCTMVLQCPRRVTEDSGVSLLGRTEAA